ncbi:nedd8-like protein [Diplodia corticola]|uniref:Nedd8-like protein n=1 Tax=Diplodia corticola TaxID=236234 RepID=A0A1J9QYL1_9PEZI|nr:nedd8-like protein [Diplodia corticola]OJD34142.1 nedd8-like protein [Diplodia corticola]
MLFAPFLTQLLLVQAIAVQARPQALGYAQNPSQEIQWGPCSLSQEPTLPMVCGTLDVPLDYTQPNSSETLTLELAKVPAANQPAKGSILFNFGGPGIPGRVSLAYGAAQMQAMEGGYHDLITFDPRGTVNTLPVSCYDSDEARAQAIQIALLGNASDVARGTIWATSRAVADSCKENAEDIGGLVGTAFYARDLMQVVDALGDTDGLLNFWGLSYGTTLGATVAAMFPDRMGNVLLDAVYNPHDYWRGQNIEMFTDTDKTFSHFLSACIDAGDTQCALASLNTTAKKLEASVYNLLDTIKYNPILYNNTLVDYSIVKGITMNTLYTPADYPTLAIFLHGLLTSNATEFGPIIDATIQSGESRSTIGESWSAIECGDKTQRQSTKEDIAWALDGQEAISRLGGDWKAGSLMTCAQWQMQAKERYLGDFRVKTKNPVLLVGNTWDPVTPFLSAKNLTYSLEGSVALEHRGAGHGSSAQISVCTSNAIRAYFLNGTMPAPGTVCEADVPLFSNITWQDVLL